MQKISNKRFTGKGNSKCKGPEAEFQDQQGGQNASNLKGSQVKPPGLAWALTWNYLGILAVGSWINTPGSNKIKED